MTQDDIIRWAREAGFNASNGFSLLIVRHSNGSWVDVQEELTRFATLVEAAARADEREACAKVCEMQENRIVQTHPARVEFDPSSMMVRKCAAAIRARSQS
jgi:hypothetical protein